VGHPTVFEMMRDLKGMAEKTMPPTAGSFAFINLTVVWCLGGLSDGVPADARPEGHGREQCRLQQEASPSLTSQLYGV
jgi:hypothetical protein